ncbi:MAG: rod shape-determining protein MreC [Rhodospirillales bacterium]|jgi:rod shape-determining protein MreC
MARDSGLAPIDDLVESSQPIRTALKRFTYVLLIGSAVGLILIGKIETVVVEKIRANSSDITAPVVELLSAPVRLARAGADHLANFANLIEENERLEEENTRLLQWRVFAKKLEAENQELKKLLRFDPGPDARFISARAIGEIGGTFARTILINVGELRGIRTGLAVMTGEGVVGRVINVGDKSARVILLTDINSRTPVLVGEGRTRAIVEGNNSDNPQIKFIDNGASVFPGDLIVTSGHGGIYPPGLPVGVVAGEIDGKTMAQTFVDWRKIEFVRVVDLGEGEDPAKAGFSKRDG